MFLRTTRERRKSAIRGTSGAGTIRQGFLEASNVEPPFELAKIHKSLQTTRALKALLGLNERCE